MGAVSARFCTTENTERKEKLTSILEPEYSASESPGGPAAASASSPQTTEKAAEAPETAEQAAALAASDASRGLASASAESLAEKRECSHASAADGETENQEHRPQCLQARRTLTLRLKPRRQASSEVLSAADAPATAQPSPGSAAQAPATPSVISINDYDFEAAKALGLGYDDSE